MEKNLRLFIAVRIPDTVKAQICAGPLSGAALKRPGIRPVPPRNLHLTLRFIGDAPETKLPDIDAALERAAAGIAVFRVRLVGGGCFPNRRSPRVFWLGLESDPGNALSALAENVKTELRNAGIPGDPKPFRPHLTVARVSERFDAAADTGAVIKALAGYETEPFPVAAVYCCSSDLSRGIPVYEKVIEKRLIG